MPLILCTDYDNVEGFWRHQGDTDNFAVFLGAKGCRVDLSLISKSATCKQKIEVLGSKFPQRFGTKYLLRASLC